MSVEYGKKNLTYTCTFLLGCSSLVGGCTGFQNLFWVFLCELLRSNILFCIYVVGEPLL